MLLLTLRGLALEDLVAPREPATPPAGSGADGPGGADGVDGADGAEGAGDGESLPPAPARGAWDPAHTDPAKLAEVLGEDVAAVIHRFYSHPLQ